MEIYHLGFRAMNCEMAAWVVASDARVAREHLIAARDFVQDVEERLSRFRPQSELSRLNAQSGEAVQVSALLWDVLQQALGAARHTNGLYDPTVLDALEAAGYDRSFDEQGRRGAGEQGSPHLCSSAPPHLRTGASAPPHLRTSAIVRPAWHDIRLDPSTRSVTLPPGVRLDLGGIAKGWAAERAADRLAGLGPCLVDAGGDIAARSAPPSQAGWPIGVAGPQNPDTDLARLLIWNQGVATSGVDYRRWVRQGVVQHHIIDPRTRRPAQTDLLAVTVVAPDAIQADLHALVALLLGTQAGRRRLARLPDVVGMLVGDDGRLFTTPGFEQYAIG